MPDKIHIVAYDPLWPELFRLEAETIRAALGSRLLQIEHVGSTSVPGLPAKPVIDILIAVADSSDETAYVPPLQSSRYVLRIREPDWHQHRMFNGPGQPVNLHVFSMDCPEIRRVLTLRNWLRKNTADRDLYARTKILLARQDWPCVQDYADAKTEVVEEILQRAYKDEVQHHC